MFRPRTQLWDLVLGPNLRAPKLFVGSQAHDNSSTGDSWLLAGLWFNLCQYNIVRRTIFGHQMTLYWCFKVILIWWGRTLRGQKDFQGWFQWRCCANQPFPACCLGWGFWDGTIAESRDVIWGNVAVAPIRIRISMCLYSTYSRPRFLLCVFVLFFFFWFSRVFGSIAVTVHWTVTANVDFLQWTVHMCTVHGPTNFIFYQFFH